jgi:hypothetical protein
LKRTLASLPALLAAAVALAACGASGAAAPAVPSLGAATGTTTRGQNQGKAALVHAAAECIRHHGIPRYQEPVVTPDGQVYSDTRSIQDAGQSAQDAADHACHSLATRAGFDPTNEPPAPAALVAAGVKAAECMRAKGLPNFPDPTAQSPYTPGHGFGIQGNAIPSGGKLSPAYQQAAGACRSLLDAEIRASTLSSLSNG